MVEQDKRDMISKILAQVPLFQSMPADELDALARSLRMVELAPGQILFHEGESGDHFYVVIAGKVEILKGLGIEGERRLALLGPGEFSGEISLFRLDSLRTASVRAFEAARLLEMSRGDFDQLLQRHPELAYPMAQVLSERLNDSHTQAITDLIEINRQLVQANEDLKAAQAQLVEKVFEKCEGSPRTFQKPDHARIGRSSTFCRRSISSRRLRRRRDKTWMIPRATSGRLSTNSYNWAWSI